MVKLRYYDGVVNIGDQLATVVNDWMVKQYKLEDNNESTVNLLTIGSILAADFFRDDAVVWGTGIHYIEDSARLAVNYERRKLDIRAVRGPITRRALAYAGYSCPRVYGDPAILMPYIYKPKIFPTKNKISVIYQWKDRLNEVPSGVTKIDVETNNYQKVIDEIVSSSMVVSASLHGIILAESYGVPAVWLIEKETDEVIKYFDWYYSTKRFKVKVASSIEEAINMEPMPLPNLDEMRAELYESYPKDIYTKYVVKEWNYVFWGFGNCFKRNIQKIEARKNEYILVDSDSNKWGTCYKNIECKSPDILKDNKNYYVVITVDNSNVIEEIIEKLQELNICCYETIDKWMRYLR
ncbi:Polysaccharide pyruvyl transferase [Pseudobutyrivibrio sp. UC1225]|uniref:polysaccharide pyruvyl transferase family protein n=1 Tax=Pseudobutyrivibrio sp. UC1225 TaxID=1798185 RepID=UPI0008EFAC24|nr:polysaccharide pyruvyl transferase family protein [Pseudobutyrivibrio sp. UC1225]SFO06921.1 Polysaccharide pyruvyl transferase [Pseudobutyrivibrio sp. UC1225]